jgi:hypothetical protein
MVRRQADRILLNQIDPAIIAAVTANVTATVEGYGILTVANQIESHKSCTSAETPKEMTIDVAIPTSCECPYEWCMTIECLPNLKLYETQTTFPANRVYCYEDPAGGTPTASATAAAIAASVNADPFACVTATVVGTVITFVAKPGVNFNAYTASGTVAVTVPYVAAVLDGEAMARLFPIKWGAVGSQPNLPFPGEDYCEYHFTIRGQEQVQDVDGANHWNDYEKEVYFYVRANDPNFAAFDVPIAGLIPIANGGTL